jgi:hypothetical protein
MAALGPKCDEGFSYLIRLSSGSGGRTTKRPSIGNAFCSILIPGPSLRGNAAPILVQRLPAFVVVSVFLHREHVQMRDRDGSFRLDLDFHRPVVTRDWREVGNVKAADANGTWNK